jgi:hypothetical protein
VPHVGNGCDASHVRPEKKPTTARRKGRDEFVATNVQTGFYGAASLERALPAFQERYAMDSETFIRAHRVDANEVAHIPGFHRHTWSSDFIEWQGLTHGVKPHADPLATQIERELEPA